MKNLDLRVAGRYRLERKIGQGGYGYVYLATDIQTGNEVAIKLEDVKIDPSALEDEAEIYKILAGGIGIPQVYTCKGEGDFNTMVFELLGPNLEDLFNFCGRTFSLKTVLMLGDQLLYRLAYIHSKEIIHRDIKPDNCLMGMGKRGNTVYVTDLGLATERDIAEPSADAPREERLHLIGTARYASIKGHLGASQHRRDDLESLGYMLLYFLKGSLPWQNLPEDDQSNHGIILEKKRAMSPDELCQGTPREFAQYFRYVHSLGDNDVPKYGNLRRIFRDLFKREGFEFDHVYDWTALIAEMPEQEAPE